MSPSLAATAPRAAVAAGLRHAARAFPTLFRVGLVEIVAYRAEFLVWILTTNMPLVMLAIWHAVAADGQGVVVSYDYRNARKCPIPDEVREAIEKLETTKAQG